jgi:hypothetical protein
MSHRLSYLYFLDWRQMIIVLEKAKHQHTRDAPDQDEKDPVRYVRLPFVGFVGFHQSIGHNFDPPHTNVRKQLDEESA